MLTKTILIFALSICIVSAQFDFNQLLQQFGGGGFGGGGQQQQQPDQGAEQQQPDQGAEQQQQPDQGAGGGFNLGQFGGGGGGGGGFNLGQIGNLLGGFGFFRAEGDDSPFSEDEINAALAEMSEDELATFEEELTFAMAEEEVSAAEFAAEDELTALATAEEELAALAAEEELLAEEGATAFATDDERAAFLDAQFQIENELAAQAIGDEGSFAAADSNNQLATSAPSTPTWAVALIVVGSLVGIALIVVQVTLVMLFRKRLPSGKPADRV